MSKNYKRQMRKAERRARAASSNLPPELRCHARQAAQPQAAVGAPAEKPAAGKQFEDMLQWLWLMLGWLVELATPSRAHAARQRIPPPGDTDSLASLRQSAGFDGVAVAGGRGTAVAATPGQVRLPGAAVLSASSGTSTYARGLGGVGPYGAAARNQAASEDSSCGGGSDGAAGTGLTASHDVPPATRQEVVEAVATDELDWVRRCVARGVTVVPAALPSGTSVDMALATGADIPFSAQVATVAACIGFTDAVLLTWPDAAAADDDQYSLDACDWVIKRVVDQLDLDLAAGTDVAVRALEQLLEHDAFTALQAFSLCWEDQLSTFHLLRMWACANGALPRLDMLGPYPDWMPAALPARQWAASPRVRSDEVAAMRTPWVCKVDDDGDIEAALATLAAEKCGVAPSELLFHGTSWDSGLKIMDGIDVDVSLAARRFGKLDFGGGFYLARDSATAVRFSCERTPCVLVFTDPRRESEPAKYLMLSDAALWADISKTLYRNEKVHKAVKAADVVEGPLCSNGPKVAGGHEPLEDATHCVQIAVRTDTAAVVYDAHLVGIIFDKHDGTRNWRRRRAVA
jgi:hypothetical protein